MADPIREALRILLNEIDDLSVLGKIPSLREAVDEARTALAAEPPAPGPTIDDIWQLCEDHEFHLGMDGANEEESAEGLLEIINTALGRWGRPAPAPAADGERDHVPDAGDMVAADGEREELAAWLDEEAKSCAAQFYDRITRAAALLRQPAPAPAPEAGEAEELAQWLEFEADNAQELGCATIYDHDRLRWAAGYLRQLPPEGLVAEEYFHPASGARIVRDLVVHSGEPGECWTVRNNRHVNPCTEFPTLAAAWAALQQARRQEVSDE